MKRFMSIAALLSVLLTSVFGVSCLKDKVFQVVVNDEVFVDFPENEQDATWDPTPRAIQLGDELDQAIADAGFNKADIVSAKISAAHYGVLKLETPGGWAVTGGIYVRRADTGGTAVTAIPLTSEALTPLIGVKKAADLQPAAVTLINDALAEYLAGTAQPILEFGVLSGSISPVPTQQNPLIFDWRAWLSMYVVVNQSSEFPDPF